MVLTPCIWVTSYYHSGLILQGQEASPPTLVKNGLHTIIWMKYSLQVLQIV
jgi:hypothetical protein